MTTTINYNGKPVPLRITTGALFRFEEAGYSLADFEDPQRQFRAQVHLVRAAIDPDTDPATVADGLPPIAEVTQAISTAIEQAIPTEDIPEDANQDTTDTTTASD